MLPLRFTEIELVRDAFINGLKSHEIRQRLLENNELTLDQAFDIANSFDKALEHSAAYLSLTTKVCLLLPRLLPEIIYTLTVRIVVLVRHARFLSHVSALFVLKLIMNVTAAPLETLFVIL